jgi:hypothetical protein
MPQQSGAFGSKLAGMGDYAAITGISSCDKQLQLLSAFISAGSGSVAAAVCPVNMGGAAASPATTTAATAWHAHDICTAKAPRYYKTEAATAAI